MTNKAAYRRHVVSEIELTIKLIAYGVPVLLLVSVINWFLDLVGVGCLLL